MKQKNAPEAVDSAGLYTVYMAGGLFTQDELTMNVMIKEAVWRLSEGKFQLLLPQSRELRAFDRPDIEAFLRNTDLLDIVKADAILARFDGLEVDAGTVVEFTFAKSLGKPAIILRSDFRRQYGTGRSEPYNLMAKNWPRTVSVHLDSFKILAGLLTSERQNLSGGEIFEATLEAELDAVHKSVDELARQVIAGLETAIGLASPYPPAYQEAVYQAARFSPGSGFDQMLTDGLLDEILQRLRKNETL